MVSLPCLSRKFPVLALGCVLAIASAGPTARAQAGLDNTVATAQRGATHDAITEQELRKQVEGTAKLESLMAKKTRPVGDVHPAPESSFMTSSIFLSDGGTFTVVPIGAVLNLPPAHRHHVVEKPKGEFILWPTFLKTNSSWLAAREVPLKMAKGDPEIAKAVLRETSPDTHVVVSVFKGGPITILEPPPEGAVPANSAPASSDSGTS